MTIISIPALLTQSDSKPVANIILHEQGWKSYSAQSDSGYLSIKSFSSAQAHYTVGRNRFLVNSMNYLLLNHGQPYLLEIEADKNKDIESFCLFFAPGFVENVRLSLAQSLSQSLSEPVQPVLSSFQFFEKTYPHDQFLSPALFQLREAVSNGKSSRGWFEEAFYQIAVCFLQVQTNICKEVEALPAIRPATREELYRRLHFVRDYIEASYSTSVTVAELAQIATLSPNHLIRNFKHVFGQTPHQYITTRRLAQARCLLSNTDQSVTDICFSLGFESLGTFSWSFSRRFGLTPSEYRRQNR